MIYPLYSKLPLDEQQQIFEHRDPNVRLIAVATNIAETSLTIPNVKYVVDSGKEKQKIYDQKYCTSKFVVNFTSKSSASQRSGRAGRTCAGFCYRVYTSGAYTNMMPDFSQPEILNAPLETSFLNLKAIGIRDIKKFPFLTRPKEEIFDVVEKEFRNIGALDKDGNLTELGKTLSVIPIKPRYAKLILMARKHDMLGYGILLVAALSR